MWIVAWAATAGAAEPSFEWTALVGVQSAFGIPLTALGSPQEPATKISIPVEASLGVVTPSGLILRAHVGTGALLEGTLLYSTSAGELVGFPHHVDLLGSAGARVGPASLGVLGGFSWPSRPTARGFAAWSPEDGPWCLEVRGGVQFPTERAVEPVLQLLVGVTGPLAGRD